MKRESFKVLLVLTVSFFIVSFIGMACTDELEAAGDEDGKDDCPVMIEQLAEKLDLDPEEILEAFKDINEELYLIRGLDTLPEIATMEAIKENILQFNYESNQ